MNVDQAVSSGFTRGMSAPSPRRVITDLSDMTASGSDRTTIWDDVVDLFVFCKKLFKTPTVNTLSAFPILASK